MIAAAFFVFILCVSNMAMEVYGIPTVANPTIKTHKVNEESVQDELKNFYSNLNDDEKAQLKKFAKTSSMANFSFAQGELFDGLKNEAAGLFVKLSGLRDVINAKLNGMQPESRLFIENLLRRFLAAFSEDGIMNILKSLKGFGKEVIDIYDGLSKPIQDDILKAFPVIGSYVTSEITRLMLQKLAELDFMSKTSTIVQPSSQPIRLQEPGDSDAEGFVKKIPEGITTNSPDTVEELLFTKKVVVNK